MAYRLCSEMTFRLKPLRNEGMERNDTHDRWARRKLRRLLRKATLNAAITAKCLEWLGVWE